VPLTANVPFWEARTFLECADKQKRSPYVRDEAFHSIMYLWFWWCHLQAYVTAGTLTSFITTYIFCQRSDVQLQILKCFDDVVNILSTMRVFLHCYIYHFGGSIDEGQVPTFAVTQIEREPSNTRTHPMAKVSHTAHLIACVESKAADLTFE
jgi:hypothetical protein